MTSILHSFESSTWKNQASDQYYYILYHFLRERNYCLAFHVFMLFRVFTFVSVGPRKKREINMAIVRSKLFNHADLKDENPKMVLDKVRSLWRSLKKSTETVELPSGQESLQQRVQRSIFQVLLRSKTDLFFSRHILKVLTLSNKFAKSSTIQWEVL